MINSKRDLQTALEDDRQLTFTTLVNDSCNKWIGVERKRGTKHGATYFTILSPSKNGGMVDSYTWYKDITISNNIISYRSNFNGKAKINGLIKILIKEY